MALLCTSLSPVCATRNKNICYRGDFERTPPEHKYTIATADRQTPDLQACCSIRSRRVAVGRRTCLLEALRTHKRPLSASAALAGLACSALNTIAQGKL